VDPKKLFHDKRSSEGCTYCGKYSGITRDHVPSKVFLDEPYPEQLPVVGVCETCNNNLSMDEEYVACLISCVIAGSVESANIERQKIRRILSDKASLRALLSESPSMGEAGSLVWCSDPRRVRNVVLKLARGHAMYEGAETTRQDPDRTLITPLLSMTRGQRQAFETPIESCVFPEIGSRQFVNALVAGDQVYSDCGWQVVQTGRYRYLASFGDHVTIRIVLSEYLACEVMWD
jgi:hypothetical protein